MNWRPKSFVKYGTAEKEGIPSKSEIIWMNNVRNDRLKNYLFLIYCVTAFIFLRKTVRTAES